MLKMSIVAMISILLTGCFLINQVYDKLYEDCYVSSDYIKGLSNEEYKMLAKKCGWKME